MSYKKGGIPSTILWVGGFLLIVMILLVFSMFAFGKNIEKKVISWTSNDKIKMQKIQNIQNHAVLLKLIEMLETKADGEMLSEKIIEWHGLDNGGKNLGRDELVKNIGEILDKITKTDECSYFLSRDSEILVLWPSIPDVGDKPVAHVNGESFENDKFHILEASKITTNANWARMNTGDSYQKNSAEIKINNKVSAVLYFGKC